MTFSSLSIDKRRKAYVRLIGEIRHALNQALSEEHAKSGLTRAAMARILGKNKSFVTKKMTGTSNMTLETLADLAFSMGRPVKISVPSSKADSSTNHVLSSGTEPGDTHADPSASPKTAPSSSNREGALVFESAA